MDGATERFLERFADRDTQGELQQGLADVDAVYLRYPLLARRRDAVAKVDARWRDHWEGAPGLRAVNP